MPTYPASIPTFTTKTDQDNYVMAAHVNRLQDEVRAIASELGAQPRGSFGSVRSRLEDLATSKAQMPHNHDDTYWRRDTVTGKGQLLASTGPNNVAPLFASANNRVLVSDDTSDTGFRFRTLTQTMLGWHRSTLRQEGQISGAHEIDLFADSVVYAEVVGDAVLSPEAAPTDAPEATLTTVILKQDSVGRDVSWYGNIVWMSTGISGVHEGVPSVANEYVMVQLTTFDAGQTWLGVVYHEVGE